MTVRAQRDGHERFERRNRGLVLLPIGLIVLITITDIQSPTDIHLGPLLVIAPALAVSFAGPRLTAAIGALAVAAQILIAVLHGGLTTSNHLAQIGALLALSILIVVFTSVRERRSRQLERAQSVAEVAQRALLRPLPERLGPLRIASMYLAAEDETQIGGDLYTATRIGTGGRLLIGDVRGKGLAAVGEAALLRIDHLVKNFPVTSGAVLRRRVGSVSAIADVSFQVGTGQTYGLVGESGCGKTTIGRCVVGLERPDGGVISIGGRDVSRLHGAPARRHRGDTHLIFQDPFASLDPRMRVDTILAEPLAIHGVDRAERSRRVRELIEEVGLPRDAGQRYPHEFSGGQRQRIGLARALALHPKLIVADEPVSALDVSIQAQILNLMADLQRRHGLTYVFISHDLSVVRYLADRIGVMYLGKLVEEGPAESVYAAPGHPYTHGLIETIPVADPWAVRSPHGITGELPSAAKPPSGCRFRTRCPLATERCATEEPVPRPIGRDGHRAACHHPLHAPDTGHRDGRASTTVPS